jgi:anti-sigma B factor antagonist
MQFTLTQVDSTTLTVSGRFDAHAAPQVAAWLTEAVQHSAELRIDMSDLTFIDSTGLATLVRSMKQCRERGGDLLITGMSDPVRIILELTRLDRAFTIVATESVSKKD